MLTLGFMLLLSGLFELHSALNWKYFTRSYSALTDYAIWSKNRGRNANLEQRIERIKQIKCRGFVLQSNFELLTVIVSAFVAFSATLPYLFPIWILSFLPRGWKKYRSWQVFDNFVCAGLFFAAAMVVFVASTTNVRVG